MPSHPDAEGELVLAALGGEKAGCVRIAETWGQHLEDLAVLAIGPRSSADQIAVTWEDVLGTGPSGASGGKALSGPGGRSAFTASLAALARPTRFPLRPGHGTAQLRQTMAAELERARKRTTALLALLALGPAFQFRLTGHVAAAHADRSGSARPALTAALSGRLAPIAEKWLGIDPDQVRGSLRGGTRAAAGGDRDGDWGSVALTGTGKTRELRVALPASWLASVWACGLGLVARHLVVAVVRPGWPDARVLALPAPGKDPVLLDVHGTVGHGDSAHWEI